MSANKPYRLRVPAETAEHIKAGAEKLGITQSEFLHRAIKRYEELATKPSSEK